MCQTIDTSEIMTIGVYNRQQWRWVRGCLDIDLIYSVCGVDGPHTQKIKQGFIFHLSSINKNQ